MNVRGAGMCGFLKGERLGDEQTAECAGGGQRRGARRGSPGRSRV